ncbi:hypothetical protein [Treponema parvum]|uniref:hypothetical protein n=1 Tax=Treponema parvum TaxID=138851 RepID=UPI001AEC009C|nr:hypothetical protein [Treponema parvum]QTQ16384.1 hypothetical protein HXT04_06610 [Treponema parvum]
MFKPKKNILFFIVSLILAGCSNESLQIDTVDTVVVFDYETENSKPLMRLSLCANMGSDIRRVDRLKLVHKETSYQWLVFTPDAYENSNLRTVGYSWISPENGMPLPKGEYVLTVYDPAGNGKDISFNISYDDLIYEKRPGDFPDALGPGAKKYNALYDKNGSLLYYEADKTDAHSAAAQIVPSQTALADIAMQAASSDEEGNDRYGLWNAADGAVIMRTCWTTADESVLCVMPSVYN